MHKGSGMLLVAFALGTWTAPALQAATYELDPAHTRLGFAVRHMVVSTVHGDFAGFSGSFDYDAANPDAMKASATIQVASISTQNERRDNDLRSANFFDVEKFPEITFESTSAEPTADGVVLHGNLTIKGVTKEIALPIAVSGPIKDPMGNERVGFEGTTTINRQDFGISWNKLLDNGSVVVGDNVKLEISVEGISK